MTRFDCIQFYRLYSKCPRFVPFEYLPNSLLTLFQIGEVARIVHYLKKHLVGRTIARVQAENDEIVYGKAGTSAAAFEQAMKGKTVVDARQQGTNLSFSQSRTAKLLTGNLDQANTSGLSCPHLRTLSCISV